MDLRFDAPILTRRDVAALADLPVSTLTSWMRPTATGRDILVHSITTERRGWPSIPIAGLAEASTVRALRTSGLSMPEILMAARYIRDRFDNEYALASPQLVHDGTHAFLEENDTLTRLRDGQQAITDVLRKHLKPLVVGSDGFVDAYLVMDHPRVVIDPRFNAGRMSLEESLVPVFAVLGALTGGDSVAAVAESFGISQDDVARLRAEAHRIGEAA